MVISNELSSEIAMVLFANQERSPEELNADTGVQLLSPRCDRRCYLPSSVQIYRGVGER